MAFDSLLEHIIKSQAGKRVPGYRPPSPDPLFNVPLDNISGDFREYRYGKEGTRDSDYPDEALQQEFEMLADQGSEPMPSPDPGIMDLLKAPGDVLSGIASDPKGYEDLQKGPPVHVSGGEPDYLSSGPPASPNEMPAEMKDFQNMSEDILGPGFAQRPTGLAGGRMLPMPQKKPSMPGAMPMNPILMNILKNIPGS